MMNAGEIVASLAVSLDGYISDVDGGVAFLEKYPIKEFDFGAFTESIGALIMGSSTYTDTIKWGWMWGDRPTLVLTKQDGLPVPDGADVRFAAMPTAEAIRFFSSETPKRLWVFGGGKVVTDGLLGGAVDALDITVIPEALGTGRPLFAEPYDGPMRLVESVAYANNAIRLVYDTRPS